MKKKVKKEPVVAPEEVTRHYGAQDTSSVQTTWSTDPAARSHGQTYLVYVVGKDETGVFRATLELASWDSHNQSWSYSHEASKGMFTALCWLLVPGIPDIAEARTLDIIEAQEEQPEREKNHDPEDVVEEDEYEWPGLHPEED